LYPQIFLVFYFKESLSKFQKEIFMKVTRDMVENEIKKLGLDIFLNAHEVDSNIIKKPVNK